MRRAGGWILVLVVVIGMAAAGLVGLRPILFRKTVTIRFHDAIQWTPEGEKPIRLAFEETGFRAGPFRAEPEFVSPPDRKERELVIQQIGPRWRVDGPGTPPSDPETLFLDPHPAIVGRQTARWALRSGIRRVFLVGSGAFEGGFEQEATAGGIECRSEFLKPQGHSLVESVLAAGPHLVILGRPVIPVVEALRKSGYPGKLLAFDEDFDPDHYSGKQPAELEGVFCAASFAPVPAEFVAKLAGLTQYSAYRMASLVLDAIDRAHSDDPAEIYRALASSAEFAADGSSTFPGALYVFRQGGLCFVEPLK